MLRHSYMIILSIKYSNLLNIKITNIFQITSIQDSRDFLGILNIQIHTSCLRERHSHMQCCFRLIKALHFK